jgi:predicted DNA-binding ribbon-helix-helix protein
MTTEQLQQANKISGQIALIDEIEKEVERFKKTRFSGSLPTSVMRYIKDNPDVAMKVVDFIALEAVNKKIVLQGQWNEL